MKKVIILLGCMLLCGDAMADYSGCCSWHGGVAYCDARNNRLVCNDGDYSPTCMCLPTRAELKSFNDMKEAKEQEKELKKWAGDYYKPLEKSKWRMKSRTKSVAELQFDLWKTREESKQLEKEGLRLKILARQSMKERMSKSRRKRCLKRLNQCIDGANLKACKRFKWCLKRDAR